MKYLKRMAVLITSLFLAATTIPAFAVPAWYGGEVKRIFVFSDGFVMTVKSSALDDCKHRYVYFKASELGHNTVDRAYSLVLLARSLEEPVSFVIDKAINGSGGYCNSNGGIDMGPKG